MADLPVDQNLLLAQQESSPSDLPGAIWNYLYPQGFANRDQPGGGLLGSDSVMGRMQRNDPTLAKDIALGFAGPIEGYHGTPHTFEPVEGNPFGEFKDQAIGSGEGAQAYGYGHYVAGNPSVASSYKKVGDADFYIDGVPLHNDEIGDIKDEGMFHGVSALVASRGNIDSAMQTLLNNEHAVNAEQFNPEKEHTRMSQFMRAEDITPEDMAQWESAFNTAKDTNIRDFKSAQKWLSENGKSVTFPKGNLLNVQIQPNEHELLDWDKPLDQQPNILNKLKSNLTEDVADAPGDYIGDSFVGHPLETSDRATGADIYKFGAQLLGPEEMSKQLHSAGIPGIKYLDAGSRQVGEGTRNYVIFNPKNLKITHRNGVPLEAVDHDPFSPPLTPVEDDPFNTGQ